jgi:hypothetical protein
VKSIAISARITKHQSGTPGTGGSTSQGASRASSAEKPEPISTMSGTTASA